MAKSRTELKGFFAAGSIPLSTHFHHLIDAPLNQADDGVKKTSDSALRIQAAPANGEAIWLYKNFPNPDNEPLAGATWRLTLQGIDSGNPPTALDVLSFQDKNAASCLSIKQGGKVGIGNENPAEALDITGNIQLTGGLSVKGTGESTFAGKLTIGASGTTTNLQVHGNILLPGATLRVNPTPADSLFQWLIGEVADNNSTPAGSVLMELKSDGSLILGSLLLGATRRDVLQEIDALKARINSLHPSPPPLRIGDTHDGGIIFQLDTQAGTGTVAQASDTAITLEDSTDLTTVAATAVSAAPGWALPTADQLKAINTALPGNALNADALYLTNGANENGIPIVYEEASSHPNESRLLTTSETKTLLVRLVRTFSTTA